MSTQGLIDFADSDRKSANTTRHHWQPLDLFSGPQVTGEELKKEGMNKSLSTKPSHIYRDRLIEALKLFPVRSRITVEQLTGTIGRPELFGATCNCVGAIINGMSKRGLIRKTGRMIKPDRKERHCTEIAEWEILKYAGG